MNPHQARKGTLGWRNSPWVTAMGHQGGECWHRPALLISPDPRPGGAAGGAPRAHTGHGDTQHPSVGTQSYSQAHFLALSEQEGAANCLWPEASI